MTKINIGVFIFFLAILSGMLPLENNILPYLLIGIGIAKLNSWWNFK